MMDHMKTTTATFLVLLSGSAVVVSTNFRREYYTDASFPCTSGDAQDGGHSSRVIANRTWSLPNKNQLVDGSSAAITEKIFVSNESFELTIKRITDEDFGVYICVIVWNDSSIGIVRHGLNLDGPVYDSLLERYKKNAIVGGVCAGVVLLIVLLTYVVWYFFCSEKKRRERRLAEDLEKGLNRCSTQAYDNVGLELYTKRSNS